MGQRIMRKKKRKAIKGVAIKRSGGSNPNNVIRIGNMTLKGGKKRRGSETTARKIAVSRKKT